MTRTQALDVYFGSRLMGTVFDTEPLAFEYAQTWLDQTDTFSLSVIPLRQGRTQSPNVLAFFENLLPEGELRRYLAEQRKASTLFSLLLEVAGDTAGGFVMLAHGGQPAKPEYAATTWSALAKTIEHQSAAAIQTGDANVRISLAGAQDKASIALFDDPAMPWLPRGSAPSTHILKPDIRRLNRIWESASNEAIVMRTAAQCGLNTARVFYEPLTRSCVVERFDRVRRDDGSLDRLIQYDFCQLAGTRSERKYEKEGGPDIRQCADIIRHYSARPALDLHAFAQWIFFNLYVGNNDSHAKNLSIYHRTSDGVRLTPFYDMMCTRIYPGLSKEFAFSIGGEVLPGQIGRRHVEMLAAQIGMNPRYTLSLALALAQKIPGAIDAAVAALLPSLSDSGRAFAEKLSNEVKSMTKRAARRIET